MRSRQYLYVALRQGLYNTGESNPVCLPYISVLIHMLYHLLLVCIYKHQIGSCKQYFVLTLMTEEPLRLYTGTKIKERNVTN